MPSARTRRTSAPSKPPTAQDTAFLRALSVLSSRSALATAAGLTFEGKRDVHAVCGYQKTLTIADYRLRQKRNAVAARILEAFPQATWRGGIEIIDSEDPEEETPFEKAWNDLAQAHAIWSVMLRADVLAGMGRYAGILIGAEGRLEEEMTGSTVKFLAPYAEDELMIDAFEEDTTSERYGLPVRYLLKRTAIQAGRPTQGESKIVHWSRVLHMADQVLDDRVYGTPRLERCWNLLDDLEKVTGAGAEAFWRRADQGMLFNIDKDVPVGTDELADLREQVDEYMHGLRRALRTRGVEVTQMGADTADFGGSVDAIILQITTGTGIPRRILTGSEAGELASSMDRTNWAERVRDRRQEFAEPHVRAFVARLIKHGMLPEPRDGDFEARWPRQEDLTETERVALATQLVSANASQINATGELLVTAEEIRDRYLGLPPLDEVDAEMTTEVEVRGADEDADEAQPGAEDEAQPPAEAETPEELLETQPRGARNRARARLVGLDRKALVRAVQRHDRVAATRIVERALGGVR